MFPGWPTLDTTSPACTTLTLSSFLQNGATAFIFLISDSRNGIHLFFVLLPLPLLLGSVSKSCLCLYTRTRGRKVASSLWVLSSFGFAPHISVHVPPSCVSSQCEKSASRVRWHR